MTCLPKWAQAITLSIFLAGLMPALLPTPAPARVVETRQYGVWEYQYFIAYPLPWCMVKTSWPQNKMILEIRMLPNRLDFFFYNSDWNLAKWREMGDTVFQIDGSDFHVNTATLDSNQALLGTFESQTGPFVRKLKAAKKMRIQFPKDQSISINLNGASAAVDAAIACWNRYQN